MTGVAKAWGNRKAGQRGMAAMIDTQEDVEDGGALCGAGSEQVSGRSLGYRLLVPARS